MTINRDTKNTTDVYQVTTQDNNVNITTIQTAITFCNSQS